MTKESELARKSGNKAAKASPRKRATSADFAVDTAKPDPSPLDFVNRRMAEEDE